MEKQDVLHFLFAIAEIYVDLKYIYKLSELDESLGLVS